jgi:hypothetical protein
VLLEPGRHGQERPQRRVRLREPTDQHDVVVGLAEVAHDGVAPLAVRGGLVGISFTEHAEALGVVDIEQRPVFPAGSGERGEVGRVAGHAVHPVDAHDPWRAHRGTAQEAHEAVEVVEPEAVDRRSRRGGGHCPVVNGAVRLRLQQYGAVAGEHGQHEGVDVRDGREHERVGSAQELGQPLLDVGVQPRVPEQSGPARVSAPAAHLLIDRVGNFRVEVESQVVA